jgi:hypothetical protein
MFVYGRRSVGGFRADQFDASRAAPCPCQDCIAEAIKHNFDVRVERYEPLKSQLALVRRVRRL